MKKSLQIIIMLVVFFCIGTNATEQEEELKRLAMMRKFLETQGANAFIKQAVKLDWHVLHIPSKWHVEHVSKAKQKAVDAAAREFGRVLVVELDKVAPMMQTLEASELLYQQTLKLLDLSDWCSETEGYGNMFLAQRCLDLAAVGSVRLTANLNFPMEKCYGLAKRLSAPWMSLGTRVRVLNKDAGAEIFPKADQNDIEEIWASGKLLLLESSHPGYRAERLKQPTGFSLRETDPIKSNLTYFTETYANEVKSTTLQDTWDYHRHAIIINNALGLQNIDKAKALAEFRRAVGNFPEKPEERVYSFEELKDRERLATEYAKRGIKVYPDDRQPEVIAFDRAWKAYLNRTYADFVKAPNGMQNLDARARQAYDEVRRGAFLDRDSQIRKEIEQSKQATSK